MSAKCRKYESIPVVKYFASKIIMYRTEKNLSREKLAYECKISTKQLLNIENCNAICKLTTTLAIARVIGLDFNELLQLLED